MNMAECDDRPNLVERAVMKLGEPQKPGPPVAGGLEDFPFNDGYRFIIIIKTISPNFM